MGSREAHWRKWERAAGMSPSSRFMEPRSVRAGRARGVGDEVSGVRMLRARCARGRASRGCDVWSSSSAWVKRAVGDSDLVFRFSFGFGFRFASPFEVASDVVDDRLQTSSFAIFLPGAITRSDCFGLVELADDLQF